MKMTTDYTDFAHVGPGTLAGRYLRRFWQPLYVAADLPAGWAKPLRILGEDFTLYRGEDGTPHVIAPRCAHRGTQLSTGWVEGDCLRCFYHGWKYDGSGQCVEQPAEDASFAAKVQIPSYPTREYLGFVFAYLGDGEAPAFPRYPMFEGAGVLEASNLYTRACSFFQNLENGIDEVHIPFVHRDANYGQAGLATDLPTVTAEETPFGLAAYGRRAGGEVRAQYVVMPNILVAKVEPDETGWKDQVAWRVPVDDEHHHSFSVRLAHLEGEAAERYRARRAELRARAAARPVSTTDLAAAVLRGDLRLAEVVEDVPARLVNLQDDVVQNGQGAIADRTHERLGRSDTAIILFRKLWARELRALAEGRPLTNWALPERFEITAGV
jgi:5,5'-dehydrodivanillate O-demethylase